MSAEEAQERTLWIGNLPYWADEEYLCLCLYHFDSVPQHRLPIYHVKVIRNTQTGHSRGYGFMTFETHEAAERILRLYNGLEVMPGTMERFCLNWAFSRSKERKPRYNKFRSKKSLSFYEITPVQLVNKKKQVKKSSNLRSSGRAYIPLDLIDDILSRLPAKSVARFRMVCKEWACLTCEPHFANRHLENRRSVSDSIVALGFTNEQYSTYFSSNFSMETVYSFRTMQFESPYGFTPPKTSYAISNSCNGLICIHSSRRKDGFASVVNPTIRETIQLPKSPAFSKRGARYGAFSMGLGYDNCSDTYKIIRIFQRKYDFRLGIIGSEYEVFSLGDATTSDCHWRHLGDIPYYVANDTPPVFLHGAIYWLVVDSNHLIQNASYTIFSVDMKTETSRTFSIPEVVKYASLMEMGGYLCTLCVDEETHTANLYILEDYVNCKWVKKNTIKHSPDTMNPIASCDGDIYLTSISVSMYGGYRYHTESETFGETTPPSISSQTAIQSNSIRGCSESLVSPISYLQRINIPCVILTIFGQRWATLFPINPSSLFN